MVSRIGEGKMASEIIQDVNIAKAIHWLQVACKDVLTDTIVHCLQKCDFKKSEANSTSNDSKIG